MNLSIITLDQLTEDEQKAAQAFVRNRNLFVKYTEAELRDWTKIDLYEALDLDGLRYEPIPRSVMTHVMKKKMTLYHPQNNRGKDVAFLLIKQAEKVLMNPRYRKLYDSVYFDESIPEDRAYSLEEFLSVFSEVFERNAVFSEHTPVPEITDNVDVFYKFWFNFKSVRIFDDPADVFGQNSAARRYNADKNKELIAKKKSADARRIADLVKLAYTRDPRIKRATVVHAPWKDAELKSLQKFNILLGKHKDKYNEISKKLNHLYLTKRSAQEIKNKIESLKK